MNPDFSTRHLTEILPGEIVCIIPEFVNKGPEIKKASQVLTSNPDRPAPFPNPKPTL